MASVQLAAYKGRTAKLTVVESSYSITDNTSILTWTLEVLGGTSNYYNMYNLEAIVNGTTVYGPISKTYDTKTFPAAKGTKTGTVTINHNPDGSHADIGFTLKGKVFNSGTETYNGTVSLTTIPRASSVSINSSNVITNSSYTITVTPAVQNTFSHILKYSFVNDSGTIASLNTSSTTYSWKIPRSLAVQIPYSTESSAEALVITCETYNGSTLVGSKTCSCKLIVDGDIIPSLSSSSIQDGNATVRERNWNIYLQNMSYVNINSMNGSGSQGSNIASYWCTFEGTDYSSTSLAGLNSQIQARGLPTTGDRTLQLWIVDSRGRPSEKHSKPYNVVAYSSPSINSYDAYRSNSSGTATDDGTCFKYSLNCSISSCNGKNPFTVNIRWKVKGSSTDTGSSKIKDGIITEASYNGSGTLGEDDIGVNNTYEIIFEVSDLFSTITRSRDISPAFELLHFHANGYAVAFGKKSSAGDNEKLFEVAMPSKFTQEIQANNGLSATYIFSGGYMLKRKVIINATNLSTNNFYPVLMQPGSDNQAEYALDCEVESTGRSGSDPWNQNYIHFRSHAGGWSDTPRNIIMDECKQYDSSEITIGAIGWGGSRSYKTCVWVRGGSSYTFITNAVNGPTLYTSDVWDPENASNCSKFTVGTNFYGGTNSNVEIPWVAGTQIDYNGIYNSSNLTIKGHFKNTNGLIYNDNNGVLTTIGAQNSGLTHYMTTASSGHYFNKQILVAGDIYGGSNYNRQLAYKDETPIYGFANDGISLRFPNGRIQITMQRYQVSTNKSSWSAWGNGYSNELTDIKNFPATFGTLYGCTVSLEGDPSGVNGILVTRTEGSSASTSRPADYQIWRPTSASGIKKYIINVVAIGTY